MRNFLVYLLFVTTSAFLYLNWSRRQIEQQIDKMQEDAFNTPGVGSPIPVSGLLAGLGTIFAQIIFGRLLRVPSWLSTLGILLGSGIAVILSWRLKRRP